MENNSKDTLKKVIEKLRRNERISIFERYPDYPNDTSILDFVCLKYNIT